MPPLLQRRTTRIDSTLSVTSFSNSLLSGYVAGCIGIALGHPLDSLKVHLQTRLPSPADYKPPKLPPLTISSSLSRLASLYAGIGPPLLSVGLLSSVNFSVYDGLRRQLFDLYPSTQRIPSSHHAPSYLTDDSYANIALASLSSGLVVSLLSAPIQTIKVIQQIQPDLTLKEAIKKIYNSPVRPPSFRNFYIGFPVHAFCDGPGRMLCKCSDASDKTRVTRRE